MESTVALPEDEYANFNLWEVEEENIRVENDRRQKERISGVFKQYPVQVNPYLNELLKSAFRKVKTLNLVGFTTFIKDEIGLAANQATYDHKNEVGGNIYG